MNQQDNFTADIKTQERYALYRRQLGLRMFWVSLSLTIPLIIVAAYPFNGLNEIALKLIHSSVALADFFESATWAPLILGATGLLSVVSCLNRIAALKALSQMSSLSIQEARYALSLRYSWEVRLCSHVLFTSALIAGFLLTCNIFSDTTLNATAAALNVAAWLVCYTVAFSGTGTKLFLTFKAPRPSDVGAVLGKTVLTNDSPSLSDVVNQLICDCVNLCEPETARALRGELRGEMLTEV